MRKKALEPINILGIVTAIFFFIIIFTWESDGRASSLEKSLSYVVIPLQKGMSYFGNKLQKNVYFIKNFKELKKINEELQREVDALTYENEVLEESKKELDRLRSLYDLDKQYDDFPKIGARIISKAPGNWYNEFTIDKGYEDGIEAGMVVLSGAGLCGRVIEAGKKHAVVMTIIDDRSSVSASLSRTDETLIVKGDLKLFNDGLLKAVNIEESVNPVEGDKVITSHLGDYYPSGILIGKIVTVEDAVGGLTKKAYIKPYVDFKNIREVLVINKLWNDYEKEDN